jgi:hypothetical protein
MTLTHTRRNFYNTPFNKYTSRDDYGYVEFDADMCDRTSWWVGGARSDLCVELAWLTGHGLCSTHRASDLIGSCHCTRVVLKVPVSVMASSVVVASVYLRSWASSHADQHLVHHLHEMAMHTRCVCLCAAACTAPWETLTRLSSQWHWWVLKEAREL